MGESADGYSYTIDGACWENEIDLSCIDPELRPLPQYYMYRDILRDGTSDPRHSYNCAYDPMAHGFSHPSSQPPSTLCPNEASKFCTDELNWDLHLLYLSPRMELSGHECCVSDYALSPDVGGSSRDSSFHMDSEYDVPLYESAEADGHGWSPAPSLVPPLSSTTGSWYQGSLSMRDLQVTPDPEGDDDEVMDDRDTLYNRIPLPEELELTEEADSPADSGLGQSIFEEMHGEEEDCGVYGSDNDSGIVAESRPKCHSVTKSRHSLRSPPQPAARGSHKSTAVDARLRRKRIASQQKASGSKAFICAFHHYDCKLAFASKNEWKRHVTSQHLQLGYYRCDLGNCSAEAYWGVYNDFNRKDLFTQHCRRMHAPWLQEGLTERDVSRKERDKYERQLETIRIRCWVGRRKPPARSRCGFCQKEFVDSADGRHKAWEQRMEHIGRHLERDGMTVEQEGVDLSLREWGLAEGIIEATRKGQYRLVSSRSTTRRQGIRGQRRSGRLVGKKQVKEESEEEDEEGDD
ncbi:hypothetical protein A1O3_09401 [Capronia epimyces CBS 606.96]|uniref:C2H2-type domain-containing protein n=1 Tax=Capronia epimyces CBS 606.96 TaxID=1182542 RepID=W9XLM9_9EURO|nr:uncharacterized protein A1O3_09401 [Capronia epimyces CBS 606.96]EXJ78240.1 hypothetical protein A1O3_09401 [Capronia epimyces CBS 606.96]